MNDLNNWSEDLSNMSMKQKGPRGIIFKIKKYAIHDGPGIRTTLFLKGCPLDCPWCHNPEGKKAEPQIMAAAAGKGGGTETVGWEISVSSAVAEIEKDLLFYDESGGGATISGGEPLMQAPFLKALLQACRDREIHTVVDTSGFAPAETFAGVIRLADRVLFDLKIMDDQGHCIHTGVSNRQIFENLKVLSASGVPHRIRFPLIPGITDTNENVYSLAEWVRSHSTADGVDILPMHRIGDGKYERLGMDNRMKKILPPTDEQIAAVKKQFEDYGISVVVGG